MASTFNNSTVSLEAKLSSQGLSLTVTHFTQFTIPLFNYVSWEPSGDSLGGAHPVTSSTHRRNRAGLARNLGQLSVPRARKGWSKGCLQGAGTGLGKVFPKRGPCTPAGPQFRERRRQNTSLRMNPALFPDVSSLPYGLPLQLLILCPECSPSTGPPPPPG